MISARAKRVIVYTASLLLAPMLVMPFEKGTREFALALAAYAVVLSLSSFYVVRGEMRIKTRDLLANKMLAASMITLVFGLILFVGSLAYLIF